MRRTTAAIRIGLISDTHGLVRPEAVAVLEGCAHIVHGGDVGDGTVLRAVFWHSVALAALVGLLVVAQTYLWPGIVPR